MTPKRQQGFTLIELLIVVGIISIIAAIAIPPLLRAARHANEDAAVAWLEEIAAGQEAYAKTCGQGTYAPSLTALYNAHHDTSDGMYLDPALGYANSAVNDGYRFEISAGPNSTAGPKDCEGVVTLTEYRATAVPVKLGSTGTKLFFVDSTKKVREARGGNPPTEPIPPSAEAVKK